MRRLTIVALSALALGGCTGTHIAKPAVCDGKHRRPANLYGTILPTLPVPMPASQGGGQSMVAPGPAPGPEAPPAPPMVPTPAPALTPAPDAESPSAKLPSAGGKSTPSTPPRTSQHDAVPRYFSC